MPNFRAVARRAARRYGLDPKIFERQIDAESGFQTGRTSGKGAQGIAQIMPATARGWGVDPNDPVAALNAAAKHMAGYVKQYGSYENALRAYNAGPGRIQQSKGFAETNAYVAKILGGKDPGKLSGSQTTGGSPATASAGSAVNVAEALLAQTQTRPQRSVTGPSLPDVLTPQNYRPLQTSGAPERPQIDIKGALERLGKTEDTLPKISGGADAVPGASEPVPGGRSPTGGKGKIIGTPHSGTHTLGNWQSDNAVDVAVPEGTLIRSTGTGTIVKVKGSYSGGSDRFDGYQVTIQTPSGQRFYTHLSKANVKAGQKIKRGQVIGRSGSANGVPHLHFGVERGDPRKFL